MRFITSCFYGIVITGHFRPISSWMSERKICWVEWLKVWDNGTVNNQEMGSKRILKRSQASSDRRHEPPAHPPASPEEKREDEIKISVKCASPLHHLNLIENSWKIMKGLEINSKSDVHMSVGEGGNKSNQTI